MIEQISNPVKFLAFYTASKQGKTGLTVTVDVYDPSGTGIVTGASATAIGGGLYSYTLSTNNSAEGEYAAIFKTSDTTVDAQHIPSLWVLGRAGVENLNATVSSRSQPSDIPAAASNASAVWGAATRTLTASLDPTAAQIRAELDANSTKLANLDATVSSRLATSGYTAPTTPPSVTAIRQEMDANSTKLANLDTTVSSRLAPGGTLARVTLVDTATTLTNSPSVPSAASIASATRTELATELGRIDASVSSRLAASGYTAPTSAPTAAQNASAVRTELAVELARIDAATSTRATPANIPAADITAIKTKTDALNTTRLGQVATTEIVGNLLAQANS